MRRAMSGRPGRTLRDLFGLVIVIGSEASQRALESKDSVALGPLPVFARGEFYRMLACPAQFILQADQRVCGG